MADGFTMFQFSIYLRHTPSRENAEVHIKRVKSILPDMGRVWYMKVTDKQSEQMILVRSRHPMPLPDTLNSSELF